MNNNGFNCYELLRKITTIVVERQPYFLRSIQARKLSTYNLVIRFRCANEMRTFNFIVVLYLLIFDKEFYRALLHIYRSDLRLLRFFLVHFTRQQCPRRYFCLFSNRTQLSANPSEYPPSIRICTLKIRLYSD